MGGIVDFIAGLNTIVLIVVFGAGVFFSFGLGLATTSEERFGCVQFSTPFIFSIVAGVRVHAASSSVLLAIFVAIAVWVAYFYFFAKGVMYARRRLLDRAE